MDHLDGALADLKPNQILALFNKVVRKMGDAFKTLLEKKIEESMKEKERLTKIEEKSHKEAERLGKLEEEAQKNKPLTPRERFGKWCENNNIPKGEEDE